ncbi:hypothetical protein ACOSQ3_027493 [Xanthoceras sorbifolium]
MFSKFSIHDPNEAKRRAIERKAKGKKKTNQLEQPHVLADEVITPPLGFLCIKDKNALELSAKKRMLETSTEGDDGLITLSLPPDASAFSDFGSISGQVKHLLLSENAARFSKMGATKAVDGLRRVVPSTANGGICKRGAVMPPRRPPAAFNSGTAYCGILPPNVPSLPISACSLTT